MKKRNIFLGMLTMVGMFFATSCSQDELINESTNGDFVNATFTIVTADGIGTRAVGDGETVNKVACAVYDAEGNELKELYKVEDVVGKTATYNVRLAKGQNYRIAFFAYNQAANAYDVTNLKNIVVNDSQLSNVEGRDAFTAYYDVETGKSMNAINETVTLKRPFAQLNLGIDSVELEDAKKAGIEVAESKIVVSNVYKAFSAFDNAVVEGAETSEMTFELNAIPTEKLKVTVNGVEELYNYLALNYLLVGDNDTEKTLTDVEFIWKGNDGETNDPTTTFLNIPVQRNYRTNIIGKLLTSPANFTIVVDDEFDGEKVVHKIFSAQDLQGVLNGNLAAGTHTFYLGADIAGDVTILQQEGVNIVIDGATHKWDGTVTINGDARSTGAETLTLKNINFDANSERSFIHAPTKVNGKYNYSHNVTVDNCTFSSDAYNEEIVGIKLLTTYKAVVKNCTATNIHSLAQFQSTDNATVIENVKVVNCKNGISLGNMASATITNAEISANGYGVRLDGANTREVAVTIKNATIEAYIPVNVRKMNDDACKATVKFEGVNSLTGDTYEIAFCSNEYENGVAPEAPKGTFTLDGAEAFRAYVGPISSASAFDAAINSNNGIVVVEGEIESVGTGFMVERDVVFDFQGNELNAGSTASSMWYALQIYGENNVVINNANFTRAGVYANAADVVFNSGVINHNPERTSRYIFCAQNGSTITINNGTFNNDRAKNSYFWADNSIIYVKGGNFGGVASNNKVVLSNGGQVIITGGTFNFDPSEWVAGGYTATKNGSTWTVAAI
jgi:hypothetical protein